MSIICNKCGRRLADNAKFCGGCGARIGEADAAVIPGVCPVCNSAIPEGIHFCTVCGTAIAASGSQTAAEDVTMDELVPPVITDDLFDGMNASAAGAAGAVTVDSVTEVYTDPIFANNNNEAKQPDPADEPTVEAVTEVYNDPIFANNNNVPKGYVPAPEPAPVPEAPVVTEPVKAPEPVVAPEPAEPEVRLPETPVIDDSMYRQSAPSPVIQPDPVQSNTYGSHVQQPYQPQGYQQPSAVPNGYQNPQQPQYQPYPDPRTMQTKAGSSGGILVPIILIILILGVLAFDVFYLFRDRIFGSDDDSSSKKSKSKSEIVRIVGDIDC